jgi:hypothetical protein
MRASLLLLEWLSGVGVPGGKGGGGGRGGAGALPYFSIFTYF